MTLNRFESEPLPASWWQWGRFSEAEGCGSGTCSCPHWNNKSRHFRNSWPETSLTITWWKHKQSNEQMRSPDPTLMPSSMSVGATWSLRSTTNLANCLTLMMYLGSSESAFMIFVHLFNESRDTFRCTSLHTKHLNMYTFPLEEYFCVSCKSSWIWDNCP